jgi:hypothetical protein
MIEKDVSVMNRTLGVMKKMEVEVRHYMKEFWGKNEQLNGGVNITEHFDNPR